MPVRPNWEEVAREHGFHFHRIDGELYWDESACYSFTLDEIEQGLEDPAQELADMCLDLVSEVVGDEYQLNRLGIPEMFHDLVRDSWQRNEPSLYGRFDFAFDGTGPAKLYEYNADTPTSVYEAAFFQWKWLEDMIASGHLPDSADQFNSIQERLIETFSTFQVPEVMHFASMAGSEEDRATVEYLRDCAMQAGLSTRQMLMEDIGTDSSGLFVDGDNQPIHWLFKLYPWEFMWEDSFAPNVVRCDTTFVEPPWKMVLSNKGLLPLLWERFEGHPNLLPAWFHDPDEPPPCDSYVVKPLLSREGANVHVVEDNREVYASGGMYGGRRYVGQALHMVPYVDGHGPVCGVWIVGNRACGLGIREDNGPITSDASRFVPHIILDERG
nr:glutathionylspermidine synthase family protein [Phaeovibrio sulfidiphilus]